jgi:hypothetical protein
MPFYVVCDPESIARVHVACWVKDRESKHCWLSEGRFLLRVVARDNETEVQEQVRRLGLTPIVELQPQHFDKFPELEKLVPRSASLEALDAAFKVATSE